MTKIVFFSLKRGKGADMGRLLLCDVRGPVGDLIQKLSEEEGSQWLEHLNKMLRKENSFEIVPVATLSGILNWQAVGEALGMENEFAELVNQYEQAPEGRWAIYVPKGLTRITRCGRGSRRAATAIPTMVTTWTRKSPRGMTATRARLMPSLFEPPLRQTRKTPTSLPTSLTSKATR